MRAKGRTPSTKVEIVSPEGRHVADAWCTYSVRSDPRVGIGPWKGRLSGVEPEGALELGSEYLLRLPDGKEGTITVRRQRRAPGRPPVFEFTGTGPPPGAAAQT